MATSTIPGRSQDPKPGTGEVDLTALRLKQIRAALASTSVKRDTPPDLKAEATKLLDLVKRKSMPQDSLYDALRFGHHSRSMAKIIADAATVSSGKSTPLGEKLDITPSISPLKQNLLQMWTTWVGNSPISPEKRERINAAARMFIHELRPKESSNDPADKSRAPKARMTAAEKALRKETDRIIADLQATDPAIQLSTLAGIANNPKQFYFILEKFHGAFSTLFAKDLGLNQP